MALMPRPPQICRCLAGILFGLACASAASWHYLIRLRWMPAT